jgi:hypothetical protein
MTTFLWSEDEFILVHDLYLAYDWRSLPPEHPAIEEMSRQLRALPTHEGERPENYRSPTSVWRRLGNYAARDGKPGFDGSQGAADRYWAKWGKKTEQVQTRAREIRARHNLHDIREFL